jgi:hypothetical protein
MSNVLKALMRGGAAALPVFVSSSVNRVTSNASNTVTAPTGIQDGDLLVAAIFHRAPAGVPVTLPSGWALLNETALSANAFALATKVANNESGNYTFGFSSANDNSVAILVYRNATCINTIGASGTADSATGTAPSITPSYAGVLCASFFTEGTANSVTTPPSGMTNRVLLQGGGLFPQTAIYDLSQPAASTGDKSIVWSGTGQACSTLLQITNEPTVAPEFVASASTQNASTGTALTINKPTGTVEGDLMVAVMCASGGNATWTGASAWVETADYTQRPDLRIAYKIAGASEPSSYTFTVSSSLTNSGTILTYRYAAYDTIGTFTAGTNPLILPSISPSESQSILIATGARDAASVTLGTPTSMTARVTDNDGTAPSYIVCDQTVAKGPTGTRSMSTGSTSEVAGIMLSIKPTRSL